MGTAFLNVTASATGRVWQERPYDERQAQALSQRFALPDSLARSLSTRGVGLEDAASFLEPKLRDLLPDPSIFLDMDKAAQRMAEAIQRDEKLAIYGDYDVDGATSSALLLRFCRAAGIAPRLYVPDRMTEGYGPNSVAMRALAADGIKLTICVDCGTTAHEPLAAARDVGMDVIVLDHHASEPQLPPALAIVNPNRLDEVADRGGAYGLIAAVGVTFLFVVAVNRLLRAANFYHASRPEPDLMQWLDLVALGTVCDVVRLSGLNRAFVAQGLKVMTRRQNAGLDVLAHVAGLSGEMDTTAAGFVLGPRVNAGGRVGKSDLGARLLGTDDYEEAQGLAQQLHALNAERREIEAAVLAEAEQMRFTDDAPISFVAQEGWHAGVIGIVASRLKEKFNHPALVVAIDGAVGKGSGRSVAGIDLGAHIIAARQAGLLINGGGHKMAAGFTVAREKMEELKEFLVARIGRQLAESPLVPTLMIDGLLSLAAATPDFVRQMERLAPFGTGNSEPRFAFADCRIVNAKVVGEKHVSVVVTQGGAKLRGIAFRAMDNGLGDLLLNSHGKSLHLAGHLRLDEWQGTERVQFQIGDGAAG